MKSCEIKNCRNTATRTIQALDNKKNVCDSHAQRFMRLYSKYSEYKTKKHTHGEKKIKKQILQTYGVNA